MSELKDTMLALKSMDETLDVQKQTNHNVSERLDAIENVTLHQVREDQRFIKNYLILLQDQMIEGFRKLGAEIEKKAVGPNG